MKKIINIKGEDFIAENVIYGNHGITFENYTNNTLFIPYSALLCIYETAKSKSTQVLDTLQLDVEPDGVK